jgi:hypothetical protein
VTSLRQIDPYVLPYLTTALKSRRRGTIKSIPRISAVYFVLDAWGNVAYIGQTTSLRERIVTQLRKFDWVPGLRIAFCCVETQQLDEVELSLIHQFNPPCNVEGRGLPASLKSRDSNKPRNYQKRFGSLIERSAS